MELGKYVFSCCRMKNSILVKIGNHRHLHSPRLLRSDVMSVTTKKRKLRKKIPLVPRIRDKKYASKIAATLKTHIDSEAKVIECYPGKGILTHELQRQGFKNITCWEPDDSYSTVLKKLQKSDCRLQLHTVSFFHEKDSSKDGDFNKLGKQPWKSDPQVKVIGLLHPEYTSIWMSKNVHNMASGAFPHSRGRAEFFFFVTGREHQLMLEKDAAVGAMNGPVPRRIFDYELFYHLSTLLKVPITAFDRKIDFGHIPKTAHWDQEHFYLVKITPKSDLYTQVCSKTDFPDFCLFTQQLFRVRRARLIPRLEQWCPSLGLLAIDRGYSMMDTVKQLRAQDLPILFKELKAQGGLEALKEDISDQRDMTLINTNQDLVLDKGDDQRTLQIDFDTQLEERLGAMNDMIPVKRKIHYEKLGVVGDGAPGMGDDCLDEKDILDESVDGSLGRPSSEYKISSSNIAEDCDSKNPKCDSTISTGVSPSYDNSVKETSSKVESLTPLPGESQREEDLTSKKETPSDDKTGASSSELREAQDMSPETNETEHRHKGNLCYGEGVSETLPYTDTEDSQSVEQRTDHLVVNNYVPNSINPENTEQNTFKTESVDLKSEPLHQGREDTQESSPIPHSRDGHGSGESSQSQSEPPKEVTPKKVSFWKRLFRGE